MIAITSIAPKHYFDDAQLRAVQSWVDNGIEVISINSPEECKLLEDKYPVNFVPTNLTGEKLWGKPYIMLNSIIDTALSQNESEDILIINSDIELGACRGLLDYHFSTYCDESIGVVQRYDYETNKEAGEKYIFGFDVFLIKKKHFKALPPSVYALGQTWWDYWLLYTMTQNGLKIHRVELPAYHKRHPQRWSKDSWQRMTKYFAWEFNLKWSRSPEQTTGKILQSINNYLNANVCN